MEGGREAKFDKEEPFAQGKEGLKRNASHAKKKKITKA